MGHHLAVRPTRFNELTGQFMTSVVKIKMLHASAPPGSAEGPVESILGDRKDSRLIIASRQRLQNFDHAGG